MNRLAIAAGSIVMGFCSVVPAYAFPIAELPNNPQSDVIQARDRGHHGGQVWHGHGHYNRGYSHYNRGYGGYRDYDHRGNGGAIIGGLAAAAIIGGALASQSHYNTGSHVQYCAERYRSYRASDNTFQPNNGPRIQCR